MTLEVNTQASSLTIDAQFLNVVLVLANGTDNDDTVTGSSQNDTLYGGGGLDALTGCLGNDFLYGEDGGDTLTGGNGTDTLDGGNDDDILNGDAANDVLLGGDGFDTLTGGSGIDDMTGGTGEDIFWFATGDIDTTAGAVTDIVRDLDTANGDRIRGSFGAGSATNYAEAGAAESSLANVLTSANTALNGTVKYYVGQVGSDSYLVTDNDGNGYTEVIQLVGVSLEQMTHTFITT